MVSGYFFDPTAATPGALGSSMWLSAFSGDLKPSPEIVKCLFDAGCDISETAVDSPDIPKGWNCLFLLVSQAKKPGNSRDFETLRLLLRQRVNVFAKDASDMTVSDYVNRSHSTTSYSPFGNYQRDLWYCALRREGIHTGPSNGMHVRTLTYVVRYRLEHYRAMCDLDAWTEKDLSRHFFIRLEPYPDKEEVTRRLARMPEDELRAQKARWKRLEELWTFGPIQDSNWYQ